MEYSSMNDVKDSGDDEKPTVQKKAPHPLFLKCDKEDFQLESLTMKDAEIGKVLWHDEGWDLASEDEVRVEFPAEMLKCRAIGREIVFYSKHEIKNFNIIQRM